MPLYDYQCSTCKKLTEVRHGFDETFDQACPHCGGALGRVFNPAPIVFKGSGFYINDSRPKGESKPAEASTPAPAPAPSSSSKESAA
ncbi:MAG TPA: FmdB family zinc ribbon protein [Candidatus Baltobacteraceae bacterium]|jgi:putative FmdB family regulatory protein